jgi:hypothetical protein
MIVKSWAAMATLRPAYLPKAHHDSVAGESPVFQSKAAVAVRDVGIDLLEAAVIEQAPEPLPGGQFSFGMLLLDGLGSSPLPERFPAAEQLFVQFVWGHGLLLEFGPVARVEDPITRTLDVQQLRVWGLVAESPNAASC